MKKFVAIDIGGTKSSVSLAKEHGGDIEIISKRRFATPQNPRAAADEIFSSAKALFAETGLSLKTFDAIGISCGGIIDAENKIVVSTPVLPYWRDVSLCKELETLLELPAFIENDANACALVEWIFGAGRGTKNMVFLTCGTGIGAGIIINGKIYGGSSGCAGEFGHVRLERSGPVGCGKAGSIEGFCSGYGIGELGKMRALELLQGGRVCGYCRSLSDIAKVDAKLLADAAFAGDKDAREVYAQAGEYLGRGISILCDILNPEAVVVGSVFVRAEKLLRPSMECAMAFEALASAREACRVVPARFDENLGDYAAVSVASEGLKTTVKVQVLV